MLVVTILKLSWGPNDFYAFLRYFFDSVIRDYALNFHAIYAGYNRTKIILGTE